MNKPITDELCFEIFDLISEGRTLTQACADLDVSKRAFNKYKRLRPDLSEALRRARIDCTYAQGDEIIDISDNDPDVNRAKVRIDARKFIVAKINPEVFGERIDVNVQAAPNMDRILAKIDALLLPNSDPSNVIDAEVIETKELTDERATGSKPDDAKDAAKIEAIESNLGAKKPNDSSN